MRVFAIGILVLFSAGCTSYLIDSSVKRYDKTMAQINLGDSKEKVLSVLEPTQKGLPRNSKKRPDQFIKDGKNYFIFYARSGRQADGITTDDEFQPYVFENNKLIGIGWALLGGARSHGQATSDTEINVQQSTTVR